MDNYVAEGKRITHTVASSAATSGEPRVVGTNLLGVMLSDGAVAAEVPAAIEGVFRLPKVTTAVIARGEQVTWDDSADAIEDEAHTIAAGDFRCGHAIEAAGNGATTVLVRINTVIAPA